MLTLYPASLIYAFAKHSVPLIGVGKHFSGRRFTTCLYFSLGGILLVPSVTYIQTTSLFRKFVPREATCFGEIP